MVTAPPPEPPLSRFNVPLDYDFTAILRVVERVVPKQFGSIDSVHQVGDDTRRHYAYEAVRQPFVAYADGSLMHLKTSLAYKVRGYYKPFVGPTVSAGCGNDKIQPRLVVELVAPVTLTSEWHLSSHARVARIEPASDSEADRCRVSVLRRDVTGALIDMARKGLVEHLPDIDRRVGEVDLTNRVANWWALLNRPIRIRDSLWLTLGPERLRIGRVTGEGRVLTAQVGLDARPRIVTGPQPRVDTLPLPPLAHDTISSGFHIMVDGIVDYPSASRAMTLALRGKTVTERGKSVTVESVTVTPARNNRLAVAVSFTGDARGTLRFLGAPRYDPTRREVTVPDLDYDLETNSQLINTFAWLGSDAIRGFFRERAHVPEAAVLDRAKTLLLIGLNRKIGDVMTLLATVDSIAVQGLYVTPTALVARAQASGYASVGVKQR